MPAKLPSPARRTAARRCHLEARRRRGGVHHGPFGKEHEYPERTGVSVPRYGASLHWRIGHLGGWLPARRASLAASDAVAGERSTLRVIGASAMSRDVRWGVRGAARG